MGEFIGILFPNFSTGSRLREKKVTRKRAKGLEITGEKMRSPMTTKLVPAVNNRYVYVMLQQAIFRLKLHVTSTVFMTGFKYVM